MQQQARQFYAAPPRNAEVEELREQVASLQQQLAIERQQPDPMEVAEEQYRLAQRYLGGGTGVSSEADGMKSSGRFSVMRPVREGNVRASTLNPRIDSARERNIGFLTAAGGLPRSEEHTSELQSRFDLVCRLLLEKKKHNKKKKKKLHMI